MRTLEALDGLRGDMRSAAEKEYAVALFRRAPDQQGNEIGACDAFRERITEKPRRPNERCSVAKHHVGIEEDAPQLNIVHGLDTEVHIGSDHVMRLPRGNHLIDSVQSLSDGDIIECDAQKRDRQLRRLPKNGRSRGRENRLLSVTPYNGCGGDLLVGPHEVSERTEGRARNGESNLSLRSPSAK